MLRKTATTVSILAMLLTSAVPAFAQDERGPDTIEPTLAECQTFVGDHGVPEERPVWENRGYSGYDVCLSMAYDGDLEGYFASSDTNGDGLLDIAEQSAYLDSVIGPVSDPEQSSLTLEKCQALVAEYGIPSERPFVDWSNRGYTDVEVCQGLAFDGDLEGSFGYWDKNTDARLDRAEMEAAVQGLSQVAPPDAETDANGVETPNSTGTEARAETTVDQAAEPEDSPLASEHPEDPRAEFAADQAAEAEDTAVRGQYANSGVAQNQSENTIQNGPTTTATTESTVPTTTTDTAEPTAPTTTTDTAEPPQQRGVLSAVNSVVEGVLPSSGGIMILGVAGAGVMISGGFLAYRRFR